MDNFEIKVVNVETVNIGGSQRGISCENVTTLLQTYISENSEKLICDLISEYDSDISIGNLKTQIVDLSKYHGDGFRFVVLYDSKTGKEILKYNEYDGKVVITIVKNKSLTIEELYKKVFNRG